MILQKLKTAPFVLIEDNYNNNTVPLLLELTQHENIYFICYEQSVIQWESAFKSYKIICFKEFNMNLLSEYTSKRCTIIIDSINQMILSLGWNKCLMCLKNIQKILNVQLIIILHKDCLLHSSKIQTSLNNLATAIVSYNTRDNSKISVQLKKGGKIMRSEEILSYDVNNRILKSEPFLVNNNSNDEKENPLLMNLSTFKIEMEQTEKLERYKLKLPYMSKQEGESKVYYEPDAVDDWDEEDPDEDLNI